jgi:hypothetical protein
MVSGIPSKMPAQRQAVDARIFIVSTFLDLVCYFSAPAKPKDWLGN